MPDEQYNIGLIVEAISKGFEQLKNNLDGVINSAATTEEALNLMSTVSDKAAIGFGAISGAASGLIVSSVKLAGRVDALGNVTENLGKKAGLTVDEVRALEQSVMDNGITMQSARQSIARMVQGNIDLAKATDLARMAQDYAVIAGKNSSDTFNHLINAIVTGQVRMLRTIGIMGTFEESYATFGREVGKSAAQLTEQEKVQARVNYLLEKGESVAGSYATAMDSVGKKITSLDRHIEESRRMLGEAWLPIYADVIDFVTNSLSAWEKLDQKTKDWISTSIGLVAVFSGLMAAFSTAVSAATRLATSFMLVKEAISVLNATVQIAGIGIATLTGGIALIVAALGTLAVAAHKAKRDLEEANKSVVDFNDTLFNLPDTRPPDVKKQAEAVAKPQTYTEYLAQIKKVIEAEGYLFRMTEEGAKVFQKGWGGGPDYEVTEKFNIATRASFEMGKANERVYESFLANKEAADAYGRELVHVEGLTRDFADTSYENIEAVTAHLEMLADQERAERIQKVMAAGLEAGLSGELQSAMENFNTTVETQGEKVEELELKLEKLRSQGYDETGTAIMEVKSDLDEARGAIAEANAALDEHISRLIYQRAAAGLSTQAALDLARSFGLLSEEDYAVATVLEDLRLQYDENADGMIDASEKADEYAESVEGLNSVVQNLIDAGLPVTIENIMAAWSSSKESQDSVLETLPILDEAVTGTVEGMDAATKGLTGIYEDTSETFDAAKTDISEAEEAVDTFTTKFLALDGKRVDVYIDVHQGGGGGGSINIANYGPGPPEEAFGGPVLGGQAVIWNEAGPGEVFIPAGSGYILNRSQAEAALAQTQIIVVPIDSGGGGGDMYVENNIYDQQSADTAFQWLSQERRNRLNSRT